MKRVLTLLLTALLAGVLSLGILPMQSAHADGPGHSARIHHRVDSKVHSLEVCKDRVSLTKCATKKNNTFWIPRGITTAKGLDIDGYFCPAYKKCRIYWSIFYAETNNRQGKKKKFVAARGPFTYKVRVL